MPEIYNIDNASNYGNAAANDVWGNFASSAMDMYKYKRSKEDAAQTELRANSREDEQNRLKNMQALLLADIQYGNKEPDGNGGYQKKEKVTDWKAMNEKHQYMREQHGLGTAKELQDQRDKLVTEIMLAGEKNPRTKKPYTVAEASEAASQIQRSQYPRISEDDWQEYTGMSKQFKFSEMSDAQKKQLLTTPGGRALLKDPASFGDEGGADYLAKQEAAEKSLSVVQPQVQSPGMGSKIEGNLGLRSGVFKDVAGSFSNAYNGAKGLMQQHPYASAAGAGMLAPQVGGGAAAFGMLPAAGVGAAAYGGQQVGNFLRESVIPDGANQNIGDVLLAMRMMQSQKAQRGQYPNPFQQGNPFGQ